MTNQNDINLIKQLIAEFNAQGKKIVSTWDAGGDQTLCNVFIQNEDGKTSVFPEATDKLNNALVYEITDQLNLPNAGERSMLST